MLYLWIRASCSGVSFSASIRNRAAQADLISRVKAADTPAARYISKYARLRGKYDYLWDELAAAAWLDPSIITKKETLFMDVDLDRGAGYGNTLTWTQQDKPKTEVQAVEVQDDADLEKFYKMFVDLLSAPTPRKN